MASLIINDTWYEDKWGNIKDESERIELAAAKIIKAQIWEMSYSMDFSPIKWWHLWCWCYMPVVAFNVANVSTTYCQIHHEKSCH